MKNFLIKGMKTVPYGCPLMAPAWWACVSYCLTDPNLQNQFKKETRFDLDSLIGCPTIEKIIDESTGKTKEIIVNWCDWITINIWGISEKIDLSKEVTIKNQGDLNSATSCATMSAFDFKSDIKKEG